jgi:hypothetical protein
VATLLVSDSSVLIDLERGRVLDALFRLPFDFGVPDLLYERELKDRDGARLVSLGLQVLQLDGAGVTLAQQYLLRERRLSSPDAFALALAKIGKHILLAGDGALRQLAAGESVECHGVLWIFDLLDDHGVLTRSQLHAALSAIAAHPRSRLPEEEVQKRLARYRTG